MKNFRRALATCSVGAIMCVGNAFGGTITQTFTVPSTGTEVSNSASNQIFNYYGDYAPAGQMLTGVTLEFTGAESVTSVSVSNGLSTQQYYTTTIAGNLLVRSFANENSDTAGQLDDPTALFALENSGNGFSGNIWSIGEAGGLNPCYMGIAGNTNQNFIPGPAPSLTNAGTVNEDGTGGACTPTEGSGTLHTDSGLISGILADYLGTGQFNLSFGTTTSTTTVNNNINTGVVAPTVAGGTFQVIYTYGPSGVPEPTTMLLFGSSLVGLGLLRRRAVKR